MPSRRTVYLLTKARPEQRRSDPSHTSRAAVNFSYVQLAFEFVSSGGMGENEAYLDRQSGKIYWHSEFGFRWARRRGGVVDAPSYRPPGQGI